jgi:hypothetical protein
MQSKDKFEISNQKVKESLKMLEEHPELIGQLNEWAHAGTKESLSELQKFIEKEKNEDIRGYAQCALEECEYFYYSSNNEQEEKDFLLAKMILEKDDKIFNLECKFESAKFALRQLDIERAVNQKIANSIKGKLKDWSHNFSEDYYKIVENRATEIKEEIDYLEEWVKSAKNMIKTERYKTIPAEVLEHIHFDCESENFWTDDEYDNEELCECEK